MRADLVLLRVDRLQADLHLGRDLVGLEALLVVQLDERAVLLGELREQAIQVLPALLLDQLIERRAIDLLVRIERAEN